MRAEYGTPIRQLLHNTNNILELINIEKSQIFETAIVNTSILIAEKKNEKKPLCIITNSKYDGKTQFRTFVENNKFTYRQEDFQGKSWALLPIKYLKIKRKIESSGKTLEQYKTKIRLGIATGSNEVFVIDENKKKELIEQNSKNRELIKPVLRGRDIYQYKYEFNNIHLILSKSGIDVAKQYPSIYRYFDSFGNKFKKRGAQGNHWTNLRHCAFFNDFKEQKIVWIELTDRGRFALCEQEIYLVNSAYFLIPPKELSAKYLLGILNSKLINFYLKMIAETSGMGTTRWIKNYVKEFPIPLSEIKNQNKLINLVNQILSITKDDDYLDNPDKQAKVKRFEKEIDALVYKLYELTPEEIKIVEGFGEK